MEILLKTLKNALSCSQLVYQLSSKHAELYSQSQVLSVVFQSTLNLSQVVPSVSKLLSRSQVVPAVFQTS